MGGVGAEVKVNHVVNGEIKATDTHTIDYGNKILPDWTRSEFGGLDSVIPSMILEEHIVCSVGVNLWYVDSNGYLILLNGDRVSTDTAYGIYSEPLEINVADYLTDDRYQQYDNLISASGSTFSVNSLNGSGQVHFYLMDDNSDPGFVYNEINYPKSDISPKTETVTVYFSSLSPWSSEPMLENLWSFSYSVPYGQSFELNATEVNELFDEFVQKISDDWLPDVFLDYYPNIRLISVTPDDYVAADHSVNIPSVKSSATITYFCEFDGAPSGWDYDADESAYSCWYMEPEYVWEINAGDNHYFNMGGAYTLTINYGQPSEGYTVTYWKNIGSEWSQNWINYTDPVTYSEGDHIEALSIDYLAANSDPDWSITGFFTGWTSSEDEYLIYYGPDYNFTMPARNVDLTAHWESEWAEDPFIMFNATGGTFDDNVIVISSTLTDELVQSLGDDFDGNPNGLLEIENITPWSTISAPFPAPTKDGYIFSHWLYETVDLDQNQVYIPWKFTGDPDAYGVPHGWVYLEAQWTPVGEGTTHNVTFNAMGGEFDNTAVITTTPSSSVLSYIRDQTDSDNKLLIVENVSNGALISEPVPAATKADSVIEGWYTSFDYEAATKWDFNTNTVTGDTTLYAKWIPGGNVPLTHFYNTNGEESEFGPFDKLVAWDVVTDLSDWPVLNPHVVFDEELDGEYQVDKIVIREKGPASPARWWEIYHYEEWIPGVMYESSRSANGPTIITDETIIPESYQFDPMPPATYFLDSYIRSDSYAGPILTGSPVSPADDPISLEDGNDGANYVYLLYKFTGLVLKTFVSPNSDVILHVIYDDEEDPLNHENNLSNPHFTFESDKEYEVEIYYSLLNSE